MKWFKHSGNARGDNKIEKLILKYGVIGYGLYFYCVEIIAGNLQSEDITFELKHDAETIAGRLQMDTLKVEEIMRWMVNEKLFQIHPSTKRIMCLGLLKRLDTSMSRNPEMLKLRNSAEYASLRESMQVAASCIPEETRREEKRREGKKSAPQKTPYQCVIDIYYRIYQKRNDGVKPTINGKVCKLIKSDLLRFKKTKYENAAGKILCDALKLYDKEEDVKLKEFIDKAGFSYETFHGMLNYILDKYSFREFLDGGSENSKENRN